MSEIDFDNLRDQSFSGDEVMQALEEAGVRPEASDDLLISLNGILANREAQKTHDNWRSAATSMAKAYERATNGSDSNIEGWHENLLNDAEYVLVLSAENEEYRRDELNKELIETAGLTYIYLEAQTGSEPDQETLQRAGVESSWVINIFNEAFRQIYPSHSPEVNDLDELASRLNFDPAHWQLIVGSRFDELRPKLIESGIQLPELGPDGLYDEERDEEAAIFGPDTEADELDEDG